MDIFTDCLIVVMTHANNDIKSPSGKSDAIHNKYRQ